MRDVVRKTREHDKLPEAHQASSDGGIEGEARPPFRFSQEGPRDLRDTADCCSRDRPVQEAPVSEPEDREPDRQDHSDPFPEIVGYRSAAKQHCTTRSYSRNHSESLKEQTERQHDNQQVQLWLVV